MNTAMDAEWFDRIKVLNARLPRRLLVNNYKKVKMDFLQNPSRNLPFSYNAVFDEECEKHLSALQILSDDIEADTSAAAALKEIYARKITEKQLQLTLLKNISHAQKEGVPVSKEVQTRNQVMCEDIYGKPSVDIFNQLFLYLKSEMKHLSEKERSSDSYKRLQAFFDKDVTTTISDLEPIDIHGREQLPIHDVAYIKQEFEKALARHQFTGWTVEISSENISSFKVRPGTRHIYIPKLSVLQNRNPGRTLTLRALQGLIAHEVDTHVVRKESGLQSDLRLLSIGLDKYLVGEEGIATYREQQFTGAQDYAASDLYFAIGIAYGLDKEGVFRDFYDTFFVLSDYYAIKYTEGDIIKAREKAFHMCCQVFKGTQSLYSGIIFTRGCVYREGNIKIHALCASNPGMKAVFDLGKFDPTNDIHLQNLQDLGLL